MHLRPCLRCGLRDRGSQRSLPWPDLSWLSISCTARNVPLAMQLAVNSSPTHAHLIFRFGDGGSTRTSINSCCVSCDSLRSAYLAAMFTATASGREHARAAGLAGRSGASVYLPVNQSPSAARSNCRNVAISPAQEPADFAAPAATATLAAPLKPDTGRATSRTRRVEAVRVTRRARRLAPPSNRDDKSRSQIGARRVPASRRLADFGVPVQSIYTVVTALAIVIGAFLLFAWALRRGSKNAGTRRGDVADGCRERAGPRAARRHGNLPNCCAWAISWCSSRMTPSGADDADRSHRPGGSRPPCGTVPAVRSAQHDEGVRAGVSATLERTGERRVS